MLTYIINAIEVANQIRLLAAILTFGFKQQSTSLASAREL